MKPASRARVDINGDMFLVPQRVYSVTGTLLDQVTYPTKFEKTDVTPDLLKKCIDLLKLVGIDYLVERDECWHQVKKYEDTLSLGEQQRLGIARLFYRSPCFAILDECTDAVSVDVEELLYETAREMGITCITISKRLALVDYHEQELRLGEESPMGFSINSIDKYVATAQLGSEWTSCEPVPAGFTLQKPQSSD